MEKTLQMGGLALEELEAQSVGLLPDRVEMRRRRRRRGGVTVINDNENTNQTAVIVFVGDFYDHNHD